MCVGECAHIEGGRATADPTNNVIRYNFYNAPLRQLTSATWFIVDDEDTRPIVPLSVNDAALVEKLYQKALTAVIPEGLDGIIRDQSVELEDGCTVVVKRNAVGYLSMKKKPTGWFGTTYTLQRGYGEYTVEGEVEELQLGPIKHLVFVVHGIGEAMWNRENVTILGLKDEVDRMRVAIQKKQIEEWKKDCDRAKNEDKAPPKPPNRTEFLPIEWFDRIHNSSTEIMTSLKAATLPTIPGLRAIANDAIGVGLVWAETHIPNTRAETNLEFFYRLPFFHQLDVTVSYQSIWNVGRNPDVDQANVFSIRARTTF